MNRRYFDHASSSPLRPVGRTAIDKALDLTGDPGRIHSEGMSARHAVEVARQQVADFFGARSREVVFTSGATESIAVACFGAAQRNPGSPSVLSAMEHSAVRLNAQRHGPVQSISVDQTGRVDLDQLLATLSQQPAIVHLQQGNHEVATLQDLAPVGAACRDHEVLLHVDAAQAGGHMALNFADLGADLVSVSAHKFGGPVGVGALLIRRGLRLAPLLLGGEQERARRAGLENTPAIAGFGAVCAALTPEVLASEETLARQQTIRLATGLSALDGVTLYGHPNYRLPHLVCLGIDGVEPQAVLLGLDRLGIAAHSGSACASEGLEPSPVLEAMGVDAHRSLRLSVGWTTTDDDVEDVLEAVSQVLAELRALRP
ncbi:MAG: cysteine desulfurase [Actinobacteria bacterium]|jgi:cysteine desulfurase|nr:cysteine desulfurase [Actinomycetota bacterium]MBT3745835.1 cysteine desulfurase [Actinomycetota bacterium]MBT3969287.1 cysteine desulfurase [Actinomycetota bacterium]MBT4009489.1 cysteine desulfurase [Actinomycetota bacterium]MBT4302386.1 cysteine desulfurase [Actinomycetota bacterium]